MNSNDIWEKIEHARALKGISWQDLSDRVGISSSFIRERGMDMKLSQFLEIGDITGFPASFFIGESLQKILNNACYFNEFINKELDSLGVDIDPCVPYPVQRTIGKLYSDVRWSFNSPLDDLTKRLKYNFSMGIKKYLSGLFISDRFQKEDNNLWEHSLVNDLYVDCFLNDERMNKVYGADKLPVANSLDFGEKKAMVNLFLHVYINKLPNRVARLAYWRK